MELTEYTLIEIAIAILILLAGIATGAIGFFQYRERISQGKLNTELRRKLEHANAQVKELEKTEELLISQKESFDKITVDQAETNRKLEKIILEQQKIIEVLK